LHSTTTTKKIKVLIIDDNEQITRMISTFLKLNDHICKICNDGIDGINMLENEKFDAILLDLAMPELDGYEVLNRLNNKEIFSKIIILTASNFSKQNLTEFKKYGINHILQKPVDIDVLLEKISSIAK